MAGTDLISRQKIEVAFEEHLKFFIFITTCNSLQQLRAAILFHHVDVAQIDLAALGKLLLAFESILLT